MGIRNYFTLFILCVPVVSMSVGCGDAFRREYFSQASSTPGYTTITIGGATLARPARTINLMKEVVHPDGTPVEQDYEAGLFALPAYYGFILYIWNSGLPNIPPNTPTTKKLTVTPGATSYSQTFSLPNSYYSFGLIGTNTSNHTTFGDSTVTTALGVDSAGGSAGDMLNLDGTAKTVNFTTYAATASSSDLFEFRPIHLTFCASGTSLSGATTSSTCSSLSGTASSATKVQVIYTVSDVIHGPLMNSVGGPVYTAGSNAFVSALLSSANSLVSGCNTLSAGSTGSTFKFAQGRSASETVLKRLRAFVVTFTGSDCISGFHKVYELPKGAWAVTNTAWTSNNDPYFIERDLSNGSVLSIDASRVNYVNTGDFVNVPKMFFVE